MRTKKTATISYPSVKIFDNMPDGYYEIDKEWRYVYVNKKGASLANKKRKELLGKTVQEAFGDAHSQIFGETAQKVMEDGKKRTIRAYYPRFNKWYENSIYSLPHGIGIFAKDITKIKEATESMFKAAAIIDSSEDAIITKSREGFITGWNNAAMRLYGYTPEEIIGQPVSVLIPPNKKSDFPKIMGRLLAGKRIGHYETQRITKDKRIIDVSITVSPIRNDMGEIIGASKIARDITKQKILEKALLESEERLRLALRVGKIGVWDWNLLDNTIIWTDELYTIYGISQQNTRITVEMIKNYTHPEDKEKVEQTIRAALKKKSMVSLEFRIITLTGETKWLVTHAIISKSPERKPARMIGAIIDVTEQRKIEQEKNDFVSIATHELKTPVTSLKAYAEVLERKFSKNGDLTSAEQLGKMNTQLNKLTNLISDLLDATKIEAGKMQTHEEKFSFDELVEEIVEELQRTTQKHSIQITGKTQSNVFADRDRTGQVMTNLIANAIKYSPNATDIYIQLQKDRNYVQICVQDFGIGIPKTKQKHVFERFYRVSGSKEKTFPGLGLGLYISSEIIKRQKGKIWVESEIGKGSKFCFKLPLHKKIVKK